MGCQSYSFFLNLSGRSSTRDCPLCLCQGIQCPPWHTEYWVRTQYSHASTTLVLWFQILFYISWIKHVVHAHIYSFSLSFILFLFLFWMNKYHEILGHLYQLYGPQNQKCIYAILRPHRGEKAYALPFLSISSIV